MAPIKRPQQLVDDEDFEVVDDERSHSNLRLDARKKPRVSYNEPASDGSQDLTDEENFEEQATQFATQQRRKQTVENVPADYGIIESVTCRNFMCHAYLEVPLGPLINFVIGHNGSGKSAILTAITICLGGKATTTNRGQSLKSFIKEGQESSTLSVKIKNTTDNAYQHEIYGDSIIVERHISRSGASNYKLKSSSERLISNRKADLEDICDYFALQIDNPMNVLTQDMARQFLNNSSPSDKYKFFMKGTQLEHLDGDYLQIEQNIEIIDQDLYQKLKDVEGLEEKMNKAKSLLMLSEKHDSLRAKIKGYGHQMAWAQVEEQERGVTEFDRRLLKADELIEGAEQKASEAGNVYDAANQAFEQAKASVLELKGNLIPTQEEKDLVKQGHDGYKADALNSQAEQRQIKQHLKIAENRIIKANSDIKEEYRRLGDANGENHTRRLAEIEEKKADVVTARTHLENHENGIASLEADKNIAEMKYRDSQIPINPKRNEIQQCEDRLKNLLRDRGQQQGAYNANMSRLLNAIKEDQGFLQKPVGPVGDHVRLLKPLWSSVLEKSFGGALSSFIVTSKQDQSRLSALMQRVACSCPIFIGNNVAINTSDNEPDSSFDTTLRVLEIDHELVRKQMIINQAIEQTVLTERRTDGVEALEGTSSRNVRQCFTLNIKPGSGLRLSRGFGGGLSQSYIDPYRGVPRMKTDIEYQISSQRGTIQRLKSELNDLEHQMRERQTTLESCKHAIVKHDRETQRLRIALQKAESIVEELQEALDNDAIEEGRLDALKGFLKEAQDEKVTHEGSFGESVIALDKVRESMRISREQMRALDLQIAEAEAKILKAENKASKASNQRATALQSKNSAIENVQNLRESKLDVERRREERAAQVADFTEQAERICPRVRVDPGETGDSLDKKLAKLSADLKKYEEKVGGDKRKIAENAAEKAEAFRRGKEEVENHEKLAQNLKMTLINRKDRWRLFQKHITARARCQFFYLLGERGFRGRLLANHKEKKLDLNVEPDETRVGKGRETKTLSGGEKSFSTICLLLSLWDAMGAPIRCLDEFDVFMDSVNRDVSMRMMIIAARRSVGRQFILITPQSMGNVNFGQDVKIIKMRDPERGQTVLTFSDT